MFFLTRLENGFLNIGRVTPCKNMYLSMDNSFNIKLTYALLHRFLIKKGNNDAFLTQKVN